MEPDTFLTKWGTAMNALTDAVQRRDTHQVARLQMTAFSGWSTLLMREITAFLKMYDVGVYVDIYANEGGLPNTSPKDLNAEEQAMRLMGEGMRRSLANLVQASISKTPPPWDVTPVLPLMRAVVATHETLFDLNHLGYLMSVLSRACPCGACKEQL